MTATHRLTIQAIGHDPRVDALRTAAGTFGIEIADHDLAIADVLVFDGDLSHSDRSALMELLVDPLLDIGSWEAPTRRALEVSLHPGVTDDRAAAAARACAVLGVHAEQIITARRIDLPDRLAADTVDLLARRVFANPVIEHWADGEQPPVHVGRPSVTIERADGPTPHAEPAEPAEPAERIDLAGLDDAGLATINAERGLALDPAELVVVRDHFSAIGRAPTDAELETIAQTWSEHCAHKTFRASIHVEGADRQDDRSLLARLRDCTDEIDAPFVRSAFVGNAGIISFHPGVSLALKAETHNHPSAVEPFGGANTGVGGVIRDVLGTGHRPIAATDVLCFGPADTPAADVPGGALHPARIRDGVIDGVADYGNKIGLPTVAGAVLYDPGFTTNPLVFCGCIGVGDDRPLPAHPAAGDRVIVLGGRTGRDGIRGATFSSATMDATTGEVAGASVQIGDPITEKLLIDVIIGAEHLYRAITDCGAGGLSSAIGEMAEGLGADVELDLVPLKYPGLAPWEIWLSEAQERMVLAVPTECVAELQARCDLHGVELSDIGAFTDDHRLIVRSHGTPIVDLDVDFLHDGRPKRSMRAIAVAPDRVHGSRAVTDPAAALLALLAHPNIASKADVVHRYDHEIRGATLVRPCTGVEADGPSDGVVLAEPGDRHGIAIGIGVNPWYGIHDAGWMAHAAIDEALRNVVAVGADPDRVALLDNFSWGDPRRASTLGSLVAAVDACCEAAAQHRAPFVSGKDSLNNEYTGADGHRHSVPPTLVITAIAHVPDADAVVTSDLAEVGDVLVLLGRTLPEFGGSHLDLIQGAPERIGSVPSPDPASHERFRRLHRAIRTGLVRACHDVSEGGLAVALAEMAIGGRLGIDVHSLPHDDLPTSWFAESSGRFVVEVAAGSLDALTELFDEPVLVLGTVIAEPVLRGPGLAPLDVHGLAHAFRGHRA